MDSLTPLLRQYFHIKKQYPDAILFFRVGDFYETFYEDAEITSRVLGITLTSRNHGKNNPVPLAGVPVKASDSYIARLVKAGYKLAICEQLEEPKPGKPVVKRDVVEVITPGTIMRPSLLSRENNFIASVVREENLWGIAFCDLSTGEFFIEETEDLRSELERISPSEVLYVFGEEIPFDGPKTPLDAYLFDPGFGKEKILSLTGASTLDGFGLEGMRVGIGAAGALIHYLEHNQKRTLPHIKRIRALRLSEFLYLDASTVKNLEIERRINGEREGSLLWAMDHTKTPMGSRLLRKWILYPLTDPEGIKRRHDAVEWFLMRGDVREEVREYLDKIGDVERIGGRIATERANARDLVSLKEALSIIPQIKNLLLEHGNEIIKEIAGKIPELEDVRELIERAIVPEPPLQIKEGGIIRDGFSKELDELREISREGKNWILRFEEEERKRTGIQSLRVGYNSVFGYYIEVTKANLKLVPSHYIRKQTLRNAERFITPELKEWETKILGAEERIKELEYEIFCKIRKNIAERIDELETLSETLAEIDVLSSFASIAQERNYTRPLIDRSTSIEIKEGRHPVVELLLPEGNFIPNDTRLNPEERIIILTGPNMSGKSTYLRQVALITILAQAGSFVPASYAKIGVVDRVFSRIGASDDLTRGVSTFLAEMNETANILNNATERSLIILDEIGRGTSTYDGLAIAWAVVEYLSSIKEKPKVIFATHYHELTGLENYISSCINYTVLVKETEKGIIFLRRVVRGKADRSYGIEVAKLAGLPGEVIERAKEILSDLEADDRIERRHPPRFLQLQLFRPEETIIQELKRIDPDELTPRQALELVYRLKENLKFLEEEKWKKGSGRMRKGRKG